MGVIFTPDQRLRVFVSSTLEELAAERRAARAAVLRLRLAPVMFELGARPHPPRDLYRAYIEQSHVFIGVYGDSYGWVAPTADVSGLEDEYQLAHDLPRLIYMRKPAPERDARLTDMLDRLRADGEVSYREFSNPSELQRLIEHDIALLLTERFEQTRLVSAAQVGADREREIPEPVRAPTPRPRSPLVARDADVTEVLRLIGRDNVAAVTLTGPPGVGKTRLAIEAVHRCASRFADGVGFAQLCQVGSAELVDDAIAKALGLPTTTARRPVDDVADYLADKELLLVVDNFEHVASGAAVLADILDAAPDVTALVTSRSPLRLRDEHVVEIAPLALPAGTGDAVEEAESAGAVRLFVDRARHANQRFALSADNVDAVTEICRRLDGMPLAIELAAAKTTVLSPPAILHRMGSQLGLLTGGHRDAPARQRTMREAIAWSHDLLEEREQQLFRRLAVFPGGFDLTGVESAARWCADDGDGGIEVDGVLDALGRLVDGNMVRQLDTAGDEPRFQMYDCISEYAGEKLLDSGEWREAHEQQAMLYFAVTIEAEPHVLGAFRRPWLNRLEAEHDNINAALDWWIDHQELPKATRLAWATWVAYWLDGHVDETAHYLARILEHADELPLNLRGRAFMAAGAASFVSGDHDRAAGLLSTARSLARSAGDAEVVALADVKLSHYDLRRHDHAAALPLLEEAREIGERLGLEWLVSLHLSLTGTIALEQGDAGIAEARIREGLRVARAANDPIGTLVGLYCLALDATTRGELDTAGSQLRDGISYAADIGDNGSIAVSADALADIVGRLGDLERSARLRAAAATIRAVSTGGWLMAYAPDWSAGHLDADALRDKLGTEGFDEASRAGAAMDLSALVRDALASSPGDD